jgi:UDP-glucose 4-epimerase
MTNTPKYLILGGAGFIGSNLARALIQQGIRPRILCRPSSSIGNVADILSHCDVIYGDLMDDVMLRRATLGIDVVFHLVSTTFPSMTIESSAYDIMSNLLPSIRLVEACLANGVKKVVYASSGGTIYGEPQTDLISEDHPLVPRSAYGQSKLTIENHLNFYARSTELDVNVLRISNPFGPSQKLIGVQGVVAIALGCALHQKTLKVYGQGAAIRDYVYIDDVINAIIIAAQTSGSSVVNISSGKGTSVMEVIREVEAASARKVHLEFVADRPGDVKVNVLNNQRAFDLYGWKPADSLQSGLQKTWRYISKA